jgi:hypothetical protein
MLTSSLNHSKCSKKRRIMSQRLRFVSREESSSSSAKTVKERKRFVELTRHSRDALRARIMTNSSINVMLIVMNMTKWTSENRKSWCHRSKNELANSSRFFSSTSLSISSSFKSKFRKRWMMFNLDSRCLFARQFKIKSRKKKWRVN